jgi:phosphonoacetaldehyde hydrolase
MKPKIHPSELKKQKASQIPWSGLRAVLFDWAGTTVDFGSLAPVEVVRDVFREYAIDVTEEEARQPMGKAKIDHLREVLSMPRIAELWNQQHGKPSDEQTVLEIYLRFLVKQKSVLAKHADLIPGVVELVDFLRGKGIKIGSTTGYTRELMEVLLPIAASSGYAPDATVCSDEVAAGRPSPWSNFRAAELLGIYPMDRVLIVDDSVAGIQAGKNAGCYSVAVTTTGNSFGLSFEAFQHLDEIDINRRHQQTEVEFYKAGADLVVESVAVLHQLWATADGKPHLAGSPRRLQSKEDI